MNSKRPNVLILMTDEHRPDVSGFGGDPVARTPTMDWLAETGVTFTNAYTPSPICVPARQCIFAGQYPKTCGCEGWIGLPSGHMTYATRFGQYGYKTTAFGKVHFQGLDQLKGWQSRPVGDVACGEVKDLKENFFDGFQVPTDDRLNCPGEMKWSDEKEVIRACTSNNPDPEDELFTRGFEHAVEDHFVGTRYDRQMPQRPSLMYLGLYNPHYPYVCHEDKFRYYLPRVPDIKTEECFDHPFLGLSPWPPSPLQTGKDIARRAVQRARAAYYAKVEAADDHLGRALDALRLANEDLDEWIIVYLSDHGDMLGEHGLWEKQKFFEESARVPLIIRWPKGLPQGQTIDQNVSLCDLFATLCDLADLEIPEGLDSRSLVPLIKGEASDWSNEVSSYFLQQGFSNVMIKQDHLKYQWYAHEEEGIMPEVLFDLSRDPKEQTNFIDASEYTEAVDQFRKRKVELGY